MKRTSNLKGLPAVKMSPQQLGNFWADTVTLYGLRARLLQYLFFLPLLIYPLTFLLLLVNHMLDSLRSEPLVHGGHESTGADVFVKLFVVVVR